MTFNFNITLTFKKDTLNFHPSNFVKLWYISEAHSKPSQTFKEELFGKIMNYF